MIYQTTGKWDNKWWNTQNNKNTQKFQDLSEGTITQQFGKIYHAIQHGVCPRNIHRVKAKIKGAEEDNVWFKNIYIQQWY